MSLSRLYIAVALALIGAPAAAWAQTPDPSQNSAQESAPGAADPPEKAIDGQAPTADSPPPADIAPPPEASIAVEPPPPDPIRVTVRGDRAEEGGISLRKRELKELPGGLGDAFRAVEAQPGVTPTATGIPYFFVRGAPPGNIGYFFDGIQVPLLFHVGGGPAVLPTSLVRRMDLYFGPYPASFGRLAGSVISAESTTPPDTWRGEAALRFGDIGAQVEGPIGDKWDVMAGGRFAVGAALVSALVPQVELSYGDYQARVIYKPAPGERLRLLAFGSSDYLATVSEPEGAAEPKKDVLLDSDFHRVDVRFDRELDSGAKLGAELTFGLDTSGTIGVERALDYQLRAKMFVEEPLLSGRVLLRAGLDASFDQYEVTPHRSVCQRPCAPGSDAYSQLKLEEAFAELFPSRPDLAVGAWISAQIGLAEDMTLTPGIRVDVLQSLGKQAIAIDPKIAGRFAIGRYIHLVPAIGVASQLPSFAPLPALQIAGFGRSVGIEDTGADGLQRSVQSSLGAELKIGPVELVSTLFRQVTFDLTDPIGTGRGTDLDRDRFLTRSRGDAYGLEIAGRGALRKNIFFLLAYTLSRATRTRAGVTQLSAYDRTHVAHAALLFDFGGGFRGGVRHVLYSGFPADEAGPGHTTIADPPRVKPFYRFDVRVAKRWELGGTKHVTLVADIQNATLAKEVFDVSCDARGCQPRTLGPITIPGLSLEGGF